MLTTLKAALPGRGSGLPEDTLWREVSIDPEHLAHYAHVCGFTLRDELPPTYPHVLAFGLHMDLLAKAPFSAVGVVHIANRIVQHRPLLLSEELTITARANGRMFGYLVSVVQPTLEKPDLIEGWHSIYFASPDMPGIGMRLQRAALDGLRERGAKQVIMRAGHRASGPRLGTFYKRLGAEAIGQMYQLEL